MAGLLCRRCKSSLPRWPDMRIYMLTSSASPEDKGLGRFDPRGQRLP